MKKDFTIKYATSGELMKAIRALDEEGKVAVLDAFVSFYDTEPTSTSPHLCDRFGDDYSTYREFKDSDYAYLFLKRSLSSMEIIVDEMDYIDPMNFFTLAGTLDKIIKKHRPKKQREARSTD